MEIIFIIITLIITTYLLAKIINFSLMYIFIFKRKPILWIIFMFFLSISLFAVGYILNLKFYVLFWPILSVSFFLFIRPESQINLLDNIKYARSTYNEIDENKGWLKKVTGNLMFIIGSCIGYYLFYY